MKKTYERPTLAKQSVLTRVTAFGTIVNGGGNGNGNGNGDLPPDF